MSSKTTLIIKMNFKTLISRLKIFVSKLRNFIKSHEFHTIIVVLVIIDCICVTCDLLLLELSKFVLHPEPKCLNTTDSSSHQIHEDSPDEDAHLFFEITEILLQIITTIILSVFTIEVIVKIILVPDIFIKSKWEILDAIVVVVSLGLNIVLMAIGDMKESVSGLIVILRYKNYYHIVCSLLFCFCVTFIYFKTVENRRNSQWY